MLDLESIKEYFPRELQDNPQYYEYMLKEFFHYRMLDIIFNSSGSDKLSFIGGTSLRIVHNIQRFSEDLDFDCFSLSRDEFMGITGSLISRLSAEGFKLIAEDKSKDLSLNAYRRTLSFPGLLYNLRLTGHKEKRFHIKIEAEPHNFEYKSDRTVIQKFNVLTMITTTPADILLSMKIAAMLERQKGRDFYDVMYLWGRTEPNYGYLRAKFGINSEEELKSRILEVCKSIDFVWKSRDFEKLVYNTEEIRKLQIFPEYIRQKL